MSSPERRVRDTQMDSNKEDALKHLASIDLIQLCNEAKVEQCRAARDLSSCGRYVQHVLVSCGHAALCAECGQRCDTCPVCRTSLPKNGNRLQLRLYNKCVEAGLISKTYSGRFQEKKDGSDHLMTDIQRLYDLFDVALENNLVSLICHYITDVCMDESAVSSDPVVAFLLDEVVVKDWCRLTFTNVISDLHAIYSLKDEALISKLPMVQKYAMQLSGIANVLEVMDSSLKDAFSAQLHDLHDLLESTLKVKQHLDVMSWCIKYQFLKDTPSRYPNHDTWRLAVQERKSAAVKRSWPDFAINSSDSFELTDATLFIEEALLNLSIEESYNHRSQEEMDISCLQDNNSPLAFQSRISLGTIAQEGHYPFESLRAAVDVLFLHGASDTVVAKQAIFLYYLFDRYWTKPDVEWRHLVNTFASCFGIAGSSVLESLVFYLLDDHTDEALQEARHLLPKIGGPETHPRIARVLLERRCPDMALDLLRCSGRDGSCAFANSQDSASQYVSLGEAVTAVRVRVESGLLTEAFMYQRMHCIKHREDRSNGRILLSDDLKLDSWIHRVEVLVTEICCLCIRRNLVDRMIELPWNADEEKYIHKCLFDHAHAEPSSIFGSLLVVYYLQRYRYVEAYQVDRKLQILEQNVMDAAHEEFILRIRSISHCRSQLVDKCLDLLPEAQRAKILSDHIPDFDSSQSPTVETTPEAVFSTETSNVNSSLLSPNLVLHKNASLLGSRKDKPEANIKSSSPTNNQHIMSANKASPSFNRKLHSSMQSPRLISTPTFPNGVASSLNDGLTGNARGQRYRIRHAENGVPSPLEFGSQDIEFQLNSHSSNGVLRKSLRLDQALTGKESSDGDDSVCHVHMQEGLRWRTDD